MTNYKLIADFDGISRLNDDGGNTSIPNGGTGWAKYQAWLASGNTPEPADVPTPEQVARQTESNQAHPLARQWFTDHPAAVAFVRLTPEQRGAQIDAMTLLQLREVIKFLVEAAVAQIKRELL